MKMPWQKTIVQCAMLAVICEQTHRNKYRPKRILSMQKTEPKSSTVNEINEERISIIEAVFLQRKNE